MGRIISDEEIARLLAEPKVMPANWASLLRTRMKPNSSHKQRDFDFQNEGGHKFRIILRENTRYAYNFSIILVFVDEDGTEYWLRRCNGKPHQHTNKVEKRNRQPNHTFRNVFHVHTATERYQRLYLEIDGYAEPTIAYNSFATALEYFFALNSFVVPRNDPNQMEFF